MTRPDVIRPFVEQAIKAFLKLDEVVVWDDGTIPISAGSTVVRVVLLEGPFDHAMVRFWAPVLQGIETTPEGQAIVAMELLAETLDNEQIAFAIRIVSAQADFLDGELSKTFGGKVTTPPGPAHPAPEGSGAKTPVKAASGQPPASDQGQAPAAAPADEETPGYI